MLEVGGGGDARRMAAVHQDLRQGEHRLYVSSGADSSERDFHGSDGILQFALPPGNANKRACTETPNRRPCHACNELSFGV